MKYLNLVCLPMAKKKPLLGKFIWCTPAPCWSPGR